MDFTSLFFIPFLFITFLVYYMVKIPFRYFILLVFNIVFILTYIKWHFFVVLGFALISFLLGLLVEKNKKSIYLSIVLVVLVFIIFKYINIFNHSLIVPLGLSFYSFKIISYLMDVYRGKVNAEHNIIMYFNYVMFFPTIISGPISRYNKFHDSIIKAKFNYKTVKNGVFLCACGIFEKVVFADYIGIAVHNIFSDDKLTGSFTVVGILLYTLQIYLDFDSYSNIAVGCSSIFGIDCGINFRTPLLTSNIKEFWHRWHISLSTWFRDYVYIPLGGNKRGVVNKYINILIVFLLSGIWHGTTLNFAVWGISHGLLMIIEDLIGKYLKFGGKVFKLLGVFVNYILVSLLFVFFKFEKFNDAVKVIINIFKPMKFNYQAINLVDREYYWLIILIVTVIILDILRYFINLIKFVGERNFVIRWSIYIIMIAIFIIFGVYGAQYNPNDFIYKHF